MMRRIFRSRGMRKFTRDRLAMFAAGIIGLYLLIALVIGVGRVITVPDTKERVLPNLYPGWLETPSMEKRLQFANWYIERAEDAIQRAERRGIDPSEELAGLALAERRLADLPVEELKQIIEEGWEAYEILEEESDVSDHLEAEKYVEACESAANRLFPTPVGWEGFLYRFRTCLGSDKLGASISLQALYSIKIAFQVGFVTALVSVLIGTTLGAAAGFFGGWVDYVVMWLVSTLSSIPTLVLLTVLVYMFTGSIFDNISKPYLALVPIYVAFCLTFWLGTCRVIRGEVMKIKELEYVQAATAIGFGRLHILFKHVVPNTVHLMFINFSLLFIGAIKSEVILSFLGMGVKGQPSWGIMIFQGKDDVTNWFFWSVLSATALMFVLVLAFNIVSDALQDAFDPKHVS